MFVVLKINWIFYLYYKYISDIKWIYMKKLNLFLEDIMNVMKKLFIFMKSYM